MSLLDKIKRSGAVKKGVDKKAHKVADYWKSVSPTFGDRPPHRAAPSHGSPGDYKDSIVIEDMSDGDSPRERVKATDFKAKWIEYGNKHMPEYAPLAKTKARFR